MSNIWISASDGDLKTVKSLIDSGNFTANSKDANGYTPIHAAVSYSHVELLEYLIEQGGDINIQDVEGDTPLHHVEDVKMAKLLVEHYKADWKKRNQDGQTPAEYIDEDNEFPEVVQYLRSLNHDNPAGGNGENLLDILPVPESVKDHQIRYTYENEDNITIDVDDERREQLRQIVESENPEEKMAEFLKNAVHDQFYSDNKDSPDSKRRRE